jgi:hypothetical protein
VLGVQAGDARRHVQAAGKSRRCSWSLGRLTTAKSRKWRAVPLADQPAAVLAQLCERARFTGRDDLVLANPVGC